jgi:sensor domain CHASE-containing protein
LQVESEGRGHCRGQRNSADEEQQLHRQHARPVFLSSRDVIKGGVLSKTGGSARDVRQAGREQFESGLQQQQHDVHSLRSSVITDGDKIVPPRARSKVRNSHSLTLPNRLLNLHSIKQVHTPHYCLPSLSYYST